MDIWMKPKNDRKKTKTEKEYLSETEKRPKKNENWKTVILKPKNRKWDPPRPPP